MSTARQAHTATLLQSGKVLVAGGLGNDGYLSGAEAYDPVGNTWSAAGSLADARVNHTATLLPSGKVLVAGGHNLDGGFFHALSGAELYDPLGNTWSAAGDMSTGREYHTATLLPSGQVLVAGGGDYYSSFTASELYGATTATALTSGPTHRPSGSRWR
jgi:hypothetical protein